ncbi:MAG: phosphoribosylaminoimidazolesuccinocarboxamide synthase [Cytophagales bacterium]|nr:phosphoribosylaminoimidazolesuccinocarboxamide synthase [Bernardetiaceae bacterium]MDW8209632.1 phosphoribosylaminoimidazolesuccinocarboxamide synthase [Cytophagales bacterium]
MQSLKQTDFHFKGQTGFYRGKVRDVYIFGNRLAIVVTDRISAFDVILPRAIPYKGQVLNQIAAHFLQATADIVPNWLEAIPHPQVSIGKRCEPFKIEMVVRGYLAGHAWRQYKAGKRTLCGEPLPEGLKENDPFPQPIITPTTKAQSGHDEDISEDEIISRGLVSEQDYALLKKYALALYQRGTQMAAQRGLILVDTKYEFGKWNGQIYLIDEVHTPDSSRYFYAEGYAERQKRGQPQRQLSKEFVREWLMENGFQGKEGQLIPPMDDQRVKSISDRYIELYEQLTGLSFQPQPYDDIQTTIRLAIENFMQH